MLAIATLLFPVMFVVGHLPCALLKLGLSRWLAHHPALPSILHGVHLLGLAVALGLSVWVCRLAWPKPQAHDDKQAA